MRVPTCGPSTTAACSPTSDGVLTVYGRGLENRAAVVAARRSALSCASPLRVQLIVAVVAHERHTPEAASASCRICRARESYRRGLRPHAARRSAQGPKAPGSSTPGRDCRPKSSIQDDSDRNAGTREKWTVSELTGTANAVRFSTSHPAVPFGRDAPHESHLADVGCSMDQTAGTRWCASERQNAPHRQRPQNGLSNTPTRPQTPEVFAIGIARHPPR